jgi:hypothetical protein
MGCEASIRPGFVSFIPLFGGTPRLASVGRSRSVRLNEGDLVPVTVPHVHFAVAPALVGWSHVHVNAPPQQFLVESIDIINQKVHQAAGHTITGEGRQMELCRVSAEPHVAGIGVRRGPEGEVLPKA